MRDTIKIDGYCQDMAAFAKWAEPYWPKPNTGAYQRPWIYPMACLRGGAECASLFDHGFVIARTLELAGTLDCSDLIGVEFSIIARTYATDLVASPPQGLGVVELPYPVANGRPVLVYPTSPGSGVISFLYALRNLSADYFSCSLPPRLAKDYWIAVGHAPNEISEMGIRLVPKKSGSEGP